MKKQIVIYLIMTSVLVSMVSCNRLGGNAEVDNTTQIKATNSNADETNATDDNTYETDYSVEEIVDDLSCVFFCEEDFYLYVETGEQDISKYSVPPIDKLVPEYKIDKFIRFDDIFQRIKSDEMTVNRVLVNTSSAYGYETKIGISVTVDNNPNYAQYSLGDIYCSDVIFETPLYTGKVYDSLVEAQKGQQNKLLLVQHKEDNETLYCVYNGVFVSFVKKVDDIIISISMPSVYNEQTEFFEYAFDTINKIMTDETYKPVSVLFAESEERASAIKSLNDSVQNNVIEP